MKRIIFAQLALATSLVFFGTAQAATTMYAINGSGGISGFSTTTGAQVFSTTDLGLPSTFGNLSFGPDGYLYADSGGWSSNGYATPIYKINISNGQVSSLGGLSNGKFVFGGSDTLYTISSNSRI